MKTRNRILALLAALVISVPLGLLFWRSTNFRPAAGVFSLLGVGAICWMTLALLHLDQFIGDTQKFASFLESRLRGKPAEVRHLRWPSNLVDEPDDRLKFSAAAFDLDVSDILHRMPSFHRVAIEHVPALFTALGILFTFIGLILGIGSLDDVSADSTRLAAGINELLPNVSLAFHSSFAGIGLSIWALVTTKWQISRAQSACYRVRTAATELDADHAPESMLESINCKTSALAELSSSQENQMAKLLDIAEDQNNKIGTLGTDIATAIDGIITRAVGEPMAQLAQSFDEYSRGELDTHSAALQNVLDRFLAEFESALGDSFQQLETVLQETLVWHERTHASLDGTAEKLDEIVASWQREAVVQTELVEARIAVQQRENQMATRLLAENEKLQFGMSEVADDMKELAPVWRSTSQSLGQMTRDLRHSADRLAEAENRVSDVSAELKDSIGNSVEGLKGSIDRFDKTLEFTPQKLEDLSAEIRSDLESGLTRSFKQFDTATSEIVGRLSGSYLEIQQTLEQIERTLDRMESLRNQRDEIRLEGG